MSLQAYGGERVATKLPKLPALDGFRAIAILIVMLSHGLTDRIPGGLGVTIFFFLSGYLITTLLRLEGERTGRISLSNFYYKRTLRIFPPLYITITVAAVISIAGLGGPVVTASGLLTDVLFLTNYAPQIGADAGVGVPLWSLDVEEHFYIFFSSLFAYVLVRMTPRRAAAICLCLAISILLIRFSVALTTDNLLSIYYWSHTRIDSILWGSILALWNNPVVDRKAWKPGRIHFATALLVLLLCLIVRDPIFRETGRYTLQGAALFVVFSYCLQTSDIIGRALGSYPLRVVALLSYTLYLIHVPALAVAEYFGLPAVVGLLASFVYAGLMYVMVERPLALRRRDRVIVGPAAPLTDEHYGERSGACVIRTIGQRPSGSGQ